MASSDPFWFFTPLQIATTVIAGANCGASSLQSPLTWPMLQDVDVPVHYVGRQTENLLHGSEFLFPPFNAFCTLGNFILAGYTYYYRNDQASAAVKYPLFATAAGLHVATTVYTLAVMAPWNGRLKKLSKALNHGIAKGEHDTESLTKAEGEFRYAQSRWKTLNYGRGAIMLLAAMANAVALSSTTM